MLPGIESKNRVLSSESRNEQNAKRVLEWFTIANVHTIKVIDIL